MESLDVDVDGGVWGEQMGFLAESEGLGMEIGGFWDEDYGAIES